MNKSKIFLLAAVTALTGGVLIGATTLNKTNSGGLSKATAGSVPHSISFTYKEITDWDNYSGYVQAELGTITAANNIFVSNHCTIQDYTEEGPSQGDSTHPYIFKINHKAYGKTNPDGTPVLQLQFPMAIDVSGVTSSIKYTTYSYSSTEGRVVADEQVDTYFQVVDYGEDQGMYVYDLNFTFKFSSVLQQYVTIDSMTINYSCTY